MSLKKHEKQLLDILDDYSEDIAALIPDTAGLHPVTLSIDGLDFDADFITASINAVIEIDTIPANEWGESESLYYRGFDTCKIVVDGVECDYSSVRIKFSNMCKNSCNY